MRGLFILLLLYVLMLATRGQHQHNFLPRPTVSMPAVNTLANTVD